MMSESSDALSVQSIGFKPLFFWNDQGAAEEQTLEQYQASLKDLSAPVFVVKQNERVRLSNHGSLTAEQTAWQVQALATPFTPDRFGDRKFLQTYGLSYALYGGSMANAISSEEFVIALGEAGFMGSFGAGGLSPAAIEKAIVNIQQALKDKPYMFNLLNSPFEPMVELRTAELYVKYNVPVVEASAYLTLTTGLVYYRATGLKQGADGSVEIGHHIIAKVSRKEVASKFMQPAPEEILGKLVGEDKITSEQARLARLVPMADDITVEADSGGHTDNRPLVSLLPAIILLRDTLQAKYQHAQPVRIGAAGGIATPASALAAFMMGAAYVVTGSINQSCVEARASEHAKNLLGQMEMTDVAMAPASDMFEMGVKVQVLKRGTMFAMRAQKLFELYSRYDSIEQIPTAEREKLETTVFKRNLNEIWEECVRFFSERDPKQVERGNKNPKDKMALIFRWYLGLSSRWSSTGEKGREMDYQIWCGPSMGAFNDWVRGSYLEPVENRRAADVALQILSGAAYLFRLRELEGQGVIFPAEVRAYPLTQ